MALSDQEIDLAAKVHYSFLPRDYSDDCVEIAVTAKPQGKIGGDYCSILPVDAKHLMVCMSDAVGHGLASALFAARINTFVLTHAFQEHSPCELTAILNQHLCQRLSDIGMFASFAAACMDFENNVMEFAGAAHPPAIHYRIESADMELLSLFAGQAAAALALLRRARRARAVLDESEGTAALVARVAGLLEQRDDAKARKLLEALAEVLETQ